MPADVKLFPEIFVPFVSRPPADRKIRARFVRVTPAGRHFSSFIALFPFMYSLVPLARFQNSLTILYKY